MKNNKLLVLMLAVVLSATLAIAFGISFSATPTLLGDVDGSGMITTTDARWALQAAVELRVLSGPNLENADVFPTVPDGKITTTDARKILDLSLKPLVLASISMNSNPTKITYIEGESLDISGAAINLNYTNGGHESTPVTAAMVTGYNPGVIGSQTVTVTYNGMNTSFNVTVNAKSVSSIAMSTNPDKTSYQSGEILDLTGAKITVYYNNSTSEIISVTSGMISGYSPTTVGAQTITVTYATKTTTFTVTVTSSVPSVDTYGNGYNFNYLCGVDMFGRTFSPVQGFNNNKQVGIFYFLWNGQHVVNTSAPVYDISALIAAGKETSDVLNTSGTTLSPLQEYHYWGKPLFGYYNASEVWVIRRHIEMLTSAGIDFIIFDCTNGPTYDAVWPTILDNMLSMQNSGWAVPKIAFYTHTDSTNAMNSLYNSLYGNTTNASKYASLFYCPKGKPMIIGDLPSATVAANMDVRPAYWPQQGIDGSFTSADAAGFPWIEWVFPQYNHNGIISVSVAQHPNGRFSDKPIQNYGSQNNWGRGCDANGNRNITTFRQGQNFQRQWDSAKNQGATTIFITGWNEWITLKHIPDGLSRIAFVDCYNEEFSRDIEPMTGGYQDSFYLQMIQNIRNYKGISGTMAIPVSKTINVNDITFFTQWDNVTNLYMNPQSTLYKRSGTPVQGSIPAADTNIYKTDLPLNNILSVKVTHDANNIYMLISCQLNVKNYTSSLVTYAVSQDRWMNVLLSTGNIQAQGWEGYKYVINRSATLATSSSGAVGTGSICLLNSDGTTGSQVGTATISYSGKNVQISIPRSAVGATGTSGFYFKVADNIKNYLDINDYYISGKSFPMGRLSYYYYF